MSLNFSHRFLLSMALLVAAMAAFPARGEAPPWGEGSYVFVAKEQTVGKVVSAFAASFGLSVDFAPGAPVDASVANGRLAAATPTEFMNQLASAHGFTWFYLRGTIHVSRSADRQTRAIPTKDVPGQTLRKMMADMGVFDPKFGWADIDSRGVVLVSGPPAYIERIQQAIEAIPAPGADHQMQVYRLRHAPVDDRVIQYRDRQITTPGIATILRNLIAGTSPAGGTNMELLDAAAPLRPGTVPLPTLEADKGGAAPLPPESGRAAVPRATGSRSQEGSRQGGAQAVIQADSRLNAVIVRDRPQTAAVYRRLIEMLDVPSELIEIEAMIVDVNSSSASELGVDWTAQSGRYTAGFGQPGKEADATTLSILKTAGSSAIAGSAQALLARIKLLEGKGAARVVSRPSILTQDNLGALIDLADTFYVQSVGERVANVTPISVGVTLRVTPRIVDTGGQRSIQLVVDIEDGSIQDTKVGTLPTVRRSTIGTQAVMRESESLVIGGFNAEEDLRTRDQVPVLGDIPGVGVLFSKTVARKERRERLFLITPRVVAQTNGGAAAQR